MYRGPWLMLPAATSSLKLWLSVICRFSKHICYSADLASGQRKPLKKANTSTVVYWVWNTSPIWVCMDLMKHEIGSTLEELQHPPIDQGGIPSGPLAVFGHIRYIITQSCFCLIAMAEFSSSGVMLRLSGLFGGNFLAGVQQLLNRQIYCKCNLEMSRTCSSEATKLGTNWEY